MGFFTRAIGRRMRKRLAEIAATPEGQAAIQQSRRVADLLERARGLAGSDLNDETACQALRKQLSSDEEPARLAIEKLGKLRDNYLDDRAYRLLTAAVEGTPVRPIDPAVRDLFQAEARLGRMSLNDAFEYLASIEPRLHEVIRRRLEGPPPKQGWSVKKEESELDLVGRFAENSNPLVNSELAASVVRQYIAARRRGVSTSDDPTPFFERRNHSGAFTFALFQKDTRPRAEN